MINIEHIKNIKNINFKEKIEELKELDQNNIGSWPGWAYNLAVFVVTVIIFIIGFWYFVLPEKAELQKEKAQEEKLKQEYTEKQIILSNLDQYREQVATMKTQFNELLQQLPTKSEVPSLLNDISQARAANGLKEELFKPLEEEESEFYVKLPNDLTVVGNYHELANFVSDVAALSRIVTLDDVSIYPADTEALNRENQLLRMSVKANTYRYNENHKKEGKK